MKKFFYLMAFVCTLGLFTACSSDDDPAVPTVWDTYQGGDYDVTAEQVDTEDGLDVDYMKMKLNVAKGDNNMAKLTITGDVDVTVPAATISQDGDNIKVSGEGTAVVEDEEDGDNSLAKIFKPASLSSRADVSHTKTIACQVSAVINTATKATTLSITATNPETGKQETLSATSAMAQSTEKSPILGVWNVEPAVEGEDGNFTGSVKINWQFKEGTSEDITGTANLFLAMGGTVANQMLPMVLKSVAFTSDGKIYAQYTDLPKTEADEPATTPKWNVADGYATYKIVDENHITVLLNSSKITEGIEDATMKTTVETILGLFKDGIPVNVRFSNNNQTAFFYIDKDFADKLQSNTVLAGFINNLKDDDLNGFGETIKALIPMVPTWIENADKIEAGIELTK